MLKRIAVKKDWTISMSEFRNFAERYQWEIDKLEEENRKLKESGRLYRNDCKKLREELKYYKEKTEFLNKVIVKYQEENEKLKEENISLHLEIEDLEEKDEEDIYEY